MLTKAQKEEVLDLVADALDGPLSPDKERRLRALVAHELPRFAKAPWSEIERTATIMVGIWDWSGELPAEA